MVERQAGAISASMEAGRRMADLPAPPLPRWFFERSPAEVAPDLLGNWLVRRLGRTWVVAQIVEVEAYLGEHDAAAHAARGRTPRTEVLYGPAGHAYLYLIYGRHVCLNVATEPAGRPGCVLLRALQPLRGTPAIRRRLARATVPDCELLSGPGRLTRGLALTREWNGHDLTHAGAFYLAASSGPRGRVLVTSRIGVTHAKDWPQRYYLADASAVTRPRGPVLAERAAQPRTLGPSYASAPQG